MSARRTQVFNFFLFFVWKKYCSPATKKTAAQLWSLSPRIYSKHQIFHPSTNESWTIKIVQTQQTQNPQCYANDDSSIPLAADIAADLWMLLLSLLSADSLTRTPKAALTTAADGAVLLTLIYFNTAALTQSEICLLLQSSHWDKKTTEHPLSFIK